MQGAERGRRGGPFPAYRPAMSANPEIGLAVDVDGIATTYHRAGSGPVVILGHGPGPGVSAFASHWTQIEHADEFNRLVGDFLA